MFFKRPYARESRLTTFSSIFSDTFARNGHEQVPATMKRIPATNGFTRASYNGCENGPPTSAKDLHRDSNGVF